MNIRWISSFALLTPVVGLTWQRTQHLVSVQIATKLEANRTKTAPPVQPDGKSGTVTPRKAPVARIVPLFDKGNKPVPLALEKFYRQSLEAQSHFAMPIKVPDKNIDYKIQIIRPDPRIDYKIQQANPRGESYGQADEPGIKEHYEAKIKALEEELKLRRESASILGLRPGEKK
jgi:hypothetical protein